MQRNIEVLLVDIGNTQIKSAEVTNGVIEKYKNWGNLEELQKHYPESIPMIGCSTNSQKVTFQNGQLINHKTPLPIELSYSTPKTLGTDRIAAAVGAYELFPSTNSLIIDMGTCITMDFLTEEGSFLGGVISPGLKMRLKAMAQHTANLPDLSEDWISIDYKTLGTSTHECLLAGAYGGIINEIDGLQKQLRENFTSINVILTGGDAHHFESRVKAHIFAGSKIVLTGLYRIWKGLNGR